MVWIFIKSSRIWGAPHGKGSLLSMVWRAGSGWFVSSRKPTKEQAMTHHVSAMLEAYPKDLGGVDKGKLAACIQACFQ